MSGKVHNDFAIVSVSQGDIAPTDVAVLTAISALPGERLECDGFIIGHGDVSSGVYSHNFKLHGRAKASAPDNVAEESPWLRGIRVSFGVYCSCGSSANREKAIVIPADMSNLSDLILKSLVVSWA